MSNAPTVFISAATIDLRSWRDLLAKAFRAAQFRVLVQDDSLGAPLGSVRELLSGAILQSDCVIHLAGLGYGGEATDPFPASPEFRCSWTQFEYYHAHEKKIPCIAFVCAPNLSKFEREEDADPERRAIKEGLQRDHCDRVQSGKFDGTPLVSLPRTLNDDVVETTEDLLIRMTKAVAGLQRKYAGLPTEAFEQAKLELNALRLLRTIPPPRVDFVGRQKELEQLRDLATKGDAAIIGLKGMGGIGKTQLAYVLAAEWAMEFPDAWILLDGRGTQGQPPAPAELLSQVIVAFCPDSGAKLPDDLIQLKALYRKILSGKRALILLDNAKDTSQAAPLEPPAGNALIVTSRRSMMLAGRASVTIGEMGPDDAAKLLRDDYEKLANDEVAELVRLCAGLPLALRLAASHLALEAAERDGEANVGAYLYALKNGRLKNLNADAEDTGEITVSETLRLSVEPLAKEEKQAWHRLAIFTSSFCAKAAEAIAGTSQTMLNFFLRRSLLEADGADRYKLHDLAVDYARANLSAEDGASLALAHAVHYEAVGSEADDLYLKGEVLAGLSLFDRERAQIEAAFVAMAARQDLAGAERVIGIVSSVVYVGNLRFHSRQWMVWLENQLRAASKTGNRKAEGDARGNLGNAYDELGEVLTAIEYYR
ncbi:MAG TPA: NB-ARC domain-containing protein, partial [Chthoniobacteraceae bacterium]|nr:NB-ARC domain-containing protein [Chthoniobacteraceae bacterium]